MDRCYDLTRFIIVGLTGVSGSLTSQTPQNVTARFLGESAEFYCGSNTTQDGTDILVPVDWTFSGEKYCIYCSGVLTYAMAGRYSANTSVVGTYILRIENITANDIGVYTCIDNAGLGPAQVSFELIVVGEDYLEQDKPSLKAVLSFRLSKLSLIFLLFYL